MSRFWQRWPRASLAAIFALPFGVTLMSWEMAARWAPGQVAVAQWRDLAAGSFLMAGAAGIVMLFLSRAELAKRVVLSVLWLTTFLIFAFCVSLQSGCGDEPNYVGEIRAPTGECG